MFSTKANHVTCTVDGHRAKGLVFLSEDPEFVTVQVFSDPPFVKGLTLSVPVKDLRELWE